MADEGVVSRWHQSIAGLSIGPSGVLPGGRGRRGRAEIPGGHGEARTSHLTSAAPASLRRCEPPPAWSNRRKPIQQT